MSDDIRSILEKLTTIESKLTPTGVKHGLNKQQKSANQMPALFKPHKISVLGTGTDPEHPAKGMAVGSNESAEPAANRLAETMASIEEDMLSKVKKDLTQYLDRLEQKVKADPDLMAKAVDDVEDMNPAVPGKQDSHDASDDDLEEDDYELTDPSTVHDVEDKINVAAGQPQAPVQTETLDDGAVFEIHGDEHNGYEIRHRGRSLPSKFNSSDDASMAIKLFKAHRAKKNPNQDYIEER